MNEGVNIPLGDKFHPWGQEVKNGIQKTLTYKRFP
jgi:hypothetical protein